ncbi:trace amine-associated receptor 3-like [Acanthopagrus schlegelii]
METLKAADLCIPLNTSRRSMPVTSRSMVIKTLLSCISVLTVVLNLLVIISISHFRQLHTPTNLILLSLAVSDLLVGLVVMPPEIILMQSCAFLDNLSCALFYLFSFILISASVGSMVLISVDRYVAICYPLRYSSMITPRRVQIYLSLCWFCSVTYNFMLLNDHLSQIDLLNSCIQECFLVINYIFGAVDLLVTFFCPLTVIIVLYMRVFVVAVSQARIMRPEDFQHMMAEVIEGLKGMVCHTDDILLWRRDQEEHDAQLNTVIQRLGKAGITLNVNKCELSTSKVVFLGRIITSTGNSP